MKKVALFLLLLMAITMITGCATNSNKTNYATGNAVSYYNQPMAGVQDQPQAQPSYSGVGCGI